MSPFPGFFVQGHELMMLVDDEGRPETYAERRKRLHNEWIVGEIRQPSRSTDMKVATYLFNAAHPRGKLFTIDAAEAKAMVDSGEWYDSPVHLQPQADESRKLPLAADRKDRTHCEYCGQPLPGFAATKAGDEPKNLMSKLQAKFVEGGKMTKAELGLLGAELGIEFEDSVTVTQRREEIQAVLDTPSL